MAVFDDSFDPDLGAACNRLAKWVEALPEGTLIDSASALTEDDLALILRRLYATRHLGPDTRAVGPAPPSTARASVPVTAKS
ncbi:MULTISPECIES: hypothetical protein [Sphingomonas]|jgi:hypothetical protein|uniref:Uncharacterized protein n=1 Tax=Sphingomonas zeae TaxID=1646122 RepID=A0A7Y6B5R9_9SPHN|nr:MULTISPECIES: hypothetical protein [Sphingomonas]MBB4048646.1 hypothetical protein [Sphingomonas zeae]MDK8186460.1 hypothetical protein [Sphingomonas zeae]MDK8216119.1 hypothetical protein [Sphingomonas sp. UMB7805-LC452B]NUU47922.1 hypothetical protein [Sphingomonas zeae]